MNDELIRVTDEEPLDAKSFAELATKAVTIRCNRCNARIEVPRLDPAQKWICRQCKEHQDYQIALRPRTVYSSRVPYVKPKTDAPKGKTARKAAKRRKREAMNGTN
jgi:hypothetical protein